MGGIGRCKIRQSSIVFVLVRSYHRQVCFTRLVYYISTFLIIEIRNTLVNVFTFHKFYFSKFQIIMMKMKLNVYSMSISIHATIYNLLQLNIKNPLNPVHSLNSILEIMSNPKKHIQKALPMIQYLKKDLLLLLSILTQTIYILELSTLVTKILRLEVSKSELQVCIIVIHNMHE